MYHFCTISTADYLYKAFALYDSLMEIDKDTFLHILCVDKVKVNVEGRNIRIYQINEIKILSSALMVIEKYSSNKDKLRWSLKPVFLTLLLETVADKVIYLDNDIYFFGSYLFLFDLLNDYNFLLTPHYYSTNPKKEQNWFEANYRVGLYNAGFVGVEKSALEHLIWWTECCAYRCEKNSLRGMFDDQKYLDLIPVINERAHIVRHKGCNVADWNRNEVPRSDRDGQLYLDGKYPLIFIHFNDTTIRSIEQGREPLLRSMYEKYFSNLQKYAPSIARKKMYGKDSLMEKLKYKIWKIVTDLGV